MSSLINVPTKDEVSDNNKAIFADLEKAVGFVPNIYATLAHSENALGGFLSFANVKSSLSTKEKEVINLVASQINGCKYCSSAHTAIGKMNGFSDEQILEIRSGEVSFDEKLNALAKLTKEAVENRGEVSNEAKEGFFAAGYTKANLMDAILVIGEITVTNYLFGISQIDIDFPLAPELETATA